jgi:[histone H3]-lysine36 N-trimethyltransferase
VYDKARLEAILALARVNQEAGAAAAAQHLKSEGSDATKRERHRDRNKDSQRKKPKISEEERKEKKLSRMVGEVVVRNMSKYRDQMEKDTFKQYAKEVSVGVRYCDFALADILIFKVHCCFGK